MDNSLTAIAGPVRLNIGNRVDLERAVANLKDSVKAYDATLATDTFLLEQMVAQPRAEFIVGVKQEPGLGQVLVIGRGGTEVEELRDYVLLLLPVSTQQISKAISSLVITRKLRLDEMAQSALVEAVQSIATFAFEHREQLVELDVNPLILDGAGTVTAVDVLIRMARNI